MGMKNKIIDILKLAVILSLMSLPIVLYIICNMPNHKSARIRQVNGVGEKIIKDYHNEWQVLPFKVGDTISEYSLDRNVGRLISDHLSGKDLHWVVIEINN